jgi:hypothetical protein
MHVLSAGRHFFRTGAGLAKATRGLSSASLSGPEREFAARELDTVVRRSAQQRLSLRRPTRPSFPVHEHHRQVVLTERVAAFGSGAEQPPRLHVIAHQPSRRSSAEVGVRLVGASGCLAGRGSASEQQACDKETHRRAPVNVCDDRLATGVRSRDENLKSEL